MATPSHSGRKHALLSVSKSSRWIACTPSAKLEEKYPRTSSVYADEGTLAHEYSEARLKLSLGMITPDQFMETEEKIKSNSLYSEEMEGYVDIYVDYVIQQYAEACRKTPGAKIFIESKVDLTNYIPDGFGTVDIAIIADGLMEIIDLKYGKGIRVEAQGNSQLFLYGLGSYEYHSLSFDINVVRMTIVQPRVGNISYDALSPAALQQWAETYVRPAAEKATRGEGDFKPGSHCHFCRHKNNCKPLAEFALSTAKYDFSKDPSKGDTPPSHTLTIEELIDVYRKGEILVNWYNSISEHVLSEAKNGVRFPGYKLVEGRSNRRITDDESVKTLLKSEGYDPEEYLNSKLKGIGDLERLLGKTTFADLLSQYVEKPPGSPTLVPESDKRPEIGSSASAARDFQP